MKDFSCVCACIWYLERMKMTEDEFDALTNEQQQDVCMEFLQFMPEHCQGIDNGQDLVACLYSDVDFCLWMGWKIV